MKINMKFENNSTLWALVIIAIFFLIVGAAQNCKGQSIPLMLGTLDSADVMVLNNPPEMFPLLGVVDVKSDSLMIDFKKYKWERLHNLTYLVDSLDITPQFDGSDEITLYIFREDKDSPEYAILRYDYYDFKLWLHYKHHTFYYAGKIF